MKNQSNHSVPRQNYKKEFSKIICIYQLLCMLLNSLSIRYNRKYSNTYKRASSIHNIIHTLISNDQPLTIKNVYNLKNIDIESKYYVIMLLATIITYNPNINYKTKYQFKLIIRSLLNSKYNLQNIKTLIQCKYVIYRCLPIFLIRKFVRFRFQLAQFNRNTRIQHGPLQLFTSWSLAHLPQSYTSKSNKRYIVQI